MIQVEPASEEARPPRLRRGYVVVLLLLGASGSLWAGRRGREAAHRAKLRDYVTICATLHDATGADWGALPTADRRAVCQVLLACPGLDWHTGLTDPQVTLTLLWVAQHDASTRRRAMALRRLGEMAVSTPDPPTDDAVGDLLGRVARVLRSSLADSEPELRAAASAAWIRFRPVARAYRLDEPSSSGWSVPSAANR